MACIENTRHLGGAVRTTNTTPEDVRKAQLYVCSRAQSTEDAALILDALGLLEEPA